MLAAFSLLPSAPLLLSCAWSSIAVVRCGLFGIMAKSPNLRIKPKYKWVVGRREATGPPLRYPP